MVGGVLKQILNGTVLLMAVMAFFLLPVGRKTSAQHLRDIFTTQPAREAAEAFASVARKLSAQVATEVERLRPGQPSQPPPPARAAPQAKHHDEPARR